MSLKGPALASMCGAGCWVRIWPGQPCTPQRRLGSAGQWGLPCGVESGALALRGGAGDKLPLVELHGDWPLLHCVDRGGAEAVPADLHEAT